MLCMSHMKEAIVDYTDGYDLRGIVVLLFSNLVSPHQEYCVHLWELFFKRSIVQRKSARTVRYLTMVYEEQLKRPWFSLITLRLRQSLKIWTPVTPLTLSFFVRDRHF